MNVAELPVVTVPPEYDRRSTAPAFLDPLRPFIDGKPAPYVFRAPRAADAFVLPVRHKTDLVTTRFGVVHRNVGTAGVIEGDRIRFGTRWACGSGSPNAILIADVKQLGICLACEDKVDPRPCVYRCYDAAGLLLYIGSTDQRRQRFRAHERNSSWWPHVADVKFENFPAILDARIAEARAIYGENPPCNRQGKAAGNTT